MAAVLRADVTDDADFGLFIFFRPAKNEFLFGRKFMARENAGTAAAKENRGGVFGEDTAVQITPDEEDGDFLRDASAAAHNLWWQGKGQRSAASRPI